MKSKIPGLTPILTVTALALTLAGCQSNTSGQTAEQNIQAALSAQSNKQPNIVVIYADDLAVGDVSAYGAGKLQTPGFDRIASEGMLFERGYATAATCTPSRYSLLTGKYPFRSKDAHILAGTAPLIISPKQETLPKMLQRAGYKTAVIGKWHLGLGDGNIDWNGHISPGANDIGFDYSYIMGATNDRTPNVYVKNGRVVNLDPNDPLEVSYARQNPYPELPSGKSNPELLKMKWSHGHNDSINNGVSRIGWQRGGKSAMWVDEEMSDLFLQEAQTFVTETKDKPFFLFYALHQPHVPRLPHSRFAGKTGLGPRGDAIAEADWAVNEFLNTLDELGLSENTIVVFSSDNGYVLDDGYHDQAEEQLGDHTPWGNMRGGKYSLLDGGAHVPFMIRWKGKIPAGSTSNVMVSQHDLLASFAALTEQEDLVADSRNTLGAFLGESQQGRSNLVTQAIGNNLSYYEGDWVFIPPYKGKMWADQVGNESGIHAKSPQLYNLKTDPLQRINLANKHPEKVQAMSEAMQAILAEE